MSDHHTLFWTRLADVQAVMLGIPGADRPMPMAPQLDDDPAEIWFLSAKGQSLVASCESGPRAADIAIADPKAALYADVQGQLSLVMDQAKVDDLWSPMAAAWYDDGRQDPDLRLMKFVPQSARIWATPSSGARFLWETLRGNVTDQQPDMGTNASITF